MRNIETKIEGGKLVVTVDLNAETWPSKSGKTLMLASTQGNVEVETPVGVSNGLRGRQPAATRPTAQALICWRNLRRDIILFMLYRLYQVLAPNATANHLAHGD